MGKDLLTQADFSLLEVLDCDAALAELSLDELSLDELSPDELPDDPESALDSLPSLFLLA